MHKLHPTIPKELEYAEKLVRLMDDQFKVPFVNFRFGLDPVLGLVPWVGDLLSLAVSVLIVSALVKHGVPKAVLAQMVVYILFDFFIGSVPVVGGVWDFFFKANRLSLRLAQKYFASQIVTA